MSDEAEIGPELAKLIARHKEKGVVHFHATWGDGGADLSPYDRAETRAAALNRIDDWLSIPANALSSRLRGEAALAGEYHALLSDDASPTERAQAKSKKQLADLLIEAAEFIEQCGTRP